MTKRYLISMIAAAAAAFGGVRGPDRAGYAITDDSSFSFTDIAGTGVRILAEADDDAATVSVGFSFRFYGRTYSSACVSTNGVVAFGGCVSEFANQDLTAMAPEGDLPMVAAYWDDLTFATAGADAIYYQTLGAAPNRRFIVQWNNAFSINGTHALTFQVVFYEQSGQIRLYYQQIEAGTGLAENNGGRATVGIRDTSGQLNGRRVQWSYRSAVLPNGSALLVSTAVPSLARLVNAASFVSGPVAPNMIVSLFGTNLACSSSLRVLLNGQRVEVLYAGESQINFVTGPGPLGQSPAAVSVDCGGVSAEPLTIELADTVPALFTASATGKGQASALNQNLSINGASEPAARQSILAVYGTGFGQAKTPGADGLSWLATEISATIGGLPAEVVYAGLAPTMTTGLQQINVRIPPDCPAGDAVPIVIRAGGRATQANVTVAVR